MINIKIGKAAKLTESDYPCSKKLKGEYVLCQKHGKDSKKVSGKNQ